MSYRTKTYIAGDWDGDHNAIDQLYKWKDSNYWSLSFTNAHDLTQANDKSLNCSIKRSLATRMDASKTFVLIVGNNTINLRSGSCSYCSSYNGYLHSCSRNYQTSLKSYIEYECDKAVRDGLKIVVLYNSPNVRKSNCPEVLREKGYHAPMQKLENGSPRWNYQSVKNALEA